RARQPLSLHDALPIFLHSFSGGRDGGAPQGGLLRDGAGNLFGSAFTGGDTGNGTVFEITKIGSFRRLHSFTGAADGTNPNGALRSEEHTSNSSHLGIS